jgi:hypothetical protein
MSTITRQPSRSRWVPKRLARLTVDQYEAMVESDVFTKRESAPSVEEVMRCWNCNHKVTRKARVCWHCEVDLTQAPSAEEAAAVLDLLEQMPADDLAELGDAMSKSATAEDFANLIMVGACPSCESEQTGDCDADPEINELLVGRCYECGQLWCTECGDKLTRTNLHCDCWDEAE